MARTTSARPTGSRGPGGAGREGGSAGPRTRRVLLRPVALLAAVFLVAAAVAWTIAFVNSSAGSVTSCNPSSVAGAGTLLGRTALDEQPAAPPGAVRVTVFNGNGQRGQGQLAAVELGDLGISEANPPDNDRLYPAHDLSCVGQIRFGPQGTSAARTLSLVVPCAELVRDARPDASVDLALGSNFRDIAPSPAVSETLRALARQSSADPAAAGPDPSALSALRAVDCSS